MANNHTGNIQPSIDLEEHRSKNVHAKAVVLHGYIPGTDQYAPITAIDNGDGTYSASSTGGSDVTSANPVIATSPYLALRLDDSSTANVTYIGKAAIGTATSAASWQIFKLDESSGLSITWADGDANFNNIWNNRTGLSYS